MAQKITADELREQLQYDPVTGEFTRKYGYTRAGEVAGYVTPKGYRMIGVLGGNYLAQRLAVLYMTGEWPLGWVDHDNRRKDDNWWTNLVQCTPGQNQQNRGATCRNKSGLLGVTQRANGKWSASIKCDGRGRHLGTHDTAELAHAAYVVAKRELHTYCPEVRA